MLLKGKSDLRQIIPQLIYLRRLRALSEKWGSRYIRATARLVISYNVFMSTGLQLCVFGIRMLRIILSCPAAKSDPRLQGTSKFKRARIIINFC
jgi:hypothetical protein